MTDENLLRDEIEVETPLEGWIQLALYCDREDIGKLKGVVESACDRLGWELNNMPARWVHVRAEKVNQLRHWHGLRDKLFRLYTTLDDIPF